MKRKLLLTEALAHAPRLLLLDEPTTGLDAASRDSIVEKIGPDVALIVLTHVHYKTGERFDMAAIQALADAHNVPLIWDLSHSTGAVPLHMAADAARFAVGCGYKYLNGGPGAPAFLYVAAEALEFLEGRLADKALQKQAEMGGDYGIRRCITETVKKLKRAK
jgi:kynureninase